MTTMPIAQLRLGNDTFHNPREDSGLDDDSLRELALSIGRMGLINPIVVAPDGLIIAGGRRYRAIAILQRWREFLAAELEADEYVLFEERAQSLRDVPVTIRHGQMKPEEIDGLALADNVLRSDLSSYEIASYVATMAENHSGKRIARAVGKSETWVSRHLSAWRAAGPELRLAWRTGRLTFEQVQRLAAQPKPEQEKAVRDDAPPPSRSIRGEANRPGIDDVKRVCRALRRNLLGGDDAARLGLDSFAAADILSWVAGEPSEFAEVVARLGLE